MKKFLLLSALFGFCVSGVEMASGADLSAAVGATGQGGMTYRLGVGFDWNKNWLENSTGHMTGYWDAGYTYWGAGSNGVSAHSLSFAPVFVYEFNGGSIKPFIEAGIGVSAFTATHVGEKDMGSSFNFEDRLGVGVKFAGNQKAGLRMIHYSNAGIKEPNNGIESYSLFYSYAM